jgi:DNA-binding NarL/FixJ family response regulator
MRSILLVDDYAPFRVVVREMLERDGFRVVGEASDGSEAIDAARRLSPDVVLLDVHLPGDDGFVVCEQMQGLTTAPQIVLTSSREIASFRRRLQGSSARGFISKADLTPGALVALLGPQAS